MVIELTINGYTNTFTFSEQEITAVHQPILDAIHAIAHRPGKRRRTVVLFAAPPGAGKSTLSAFWEYLAGTKSDTVQDAPSINLQSLSIDGFHYPNVYLETHAIIREGGEVPLKAIKGAPETYDVDALLQKVIDIRTGSAPVAWPEYDRNLHDPVQDAVQITAECVVVEGNWVLLKDGPWSELANLADITILLKADAELLRERLIERKLRGGFDREFVLKHYENVDKPNGELVLKQSIGADIELSLGFGGLTLESVK